MKKIITVVILFFLVWIGYTKFIDQNTAYPWEVFHSPPPAEATVAWKSYGDCWENFRLNFPYHIQVIGISEEYRDKSQVIIISEPPPLVEKNKIDEIFSSEHLKVEEKTNSIGVDGWVKDLVLVISGGSERQKKRSIDRLYEYIYGSDYKPHYLNLSKAPATFNNTVKNANYSVTAAELNAWFMTGNDQLFTGLDKTTESKLSELIDENKFGVYYSKIPGFVTWLIPKGNIDGYRKDAFQFTMDADLILGAIAGTGSLAVIGRERESDIFALPPLRVETILQLAGADKDQLSQSYERMNMFAGKLANGADWAPIYLSKDLVNTEYGSLLNITDQLLKSWSQHGEVSYYNFMYKKPDPESYPYPQSLLKEINTQTITFNWNTKGAAYIVKYNDYDVAAINRTGSLPVTFIPEGLDHDNIPYKKIRDCEENFYNFFSAHSDPNLIRVVQYASLYQIFSAFAVDATGGADDTVPAPTEDVPKKYAKRLLEKIRDQDIAPDNTGDLYYTPVDYDDFLKLRIQSANYIDAKIAIEKMTPQVKDIYNRMGDEGLNLLAYFIAHPRGENDKNVTYDRSIISQDNLDNLIDFYKINSKNLRDLNRGLQIAGFSRSEIKDKYITSFGASHANWIKTPSVVLSWDADSIVMTGGHNISARMLGVEVDGALAKGEIKIIENDGVRKMLVAGEDINHITPGMIREMEINGKTGLQHIEGKMLDGTVRERNIVFTDTHSSGRGYNEVKFSPSAGNETEINLNGTYLKQVTIKGEDFVSQSSSPYILYRKSNASSIESINEAMRNRKIVSGEFKVLSFVDDETTNATLRNYCHRNFIDHPVSSIGDLDDLFARNPGKTFNLVGHIENNAIYNAEQGLMLPLSAIQKAAAANNVNYMIIGCESAFEKGVTGGFVSKINSVEVAEALGMAIESAKNVSTFIHTLARNSDLKFIVYEMPVRELGFAAAREQRIAIIAGSVLGAGAGTVVVVAIAAPQPQNGKNENDTLKAVTSTY